MCGIAGIISRRENIKTKTLEAMATQMAHRGPDDQGIETIPLSTGKDLAFALVHRRLSIIDLSDAAHQPMTDPKTGNWIVYNGEIYNYKQLKRRLKEQGCAFKSNSDTETILKAYQIYGVDCLEKLSGMFAFAIWDVKKQILFLAVDRFGIKPLYFYEGKQGQFLFSSEVRTLLKSGLIDKQVEPLAIESYLAYGAIQAPLSIIRGIYSLLPAHYMIYNPNNRNLHTVKYWSPAGNSTNSLCSNEKETIYQLRDLLEESVESHLVSDVPVGLFLSGGIDSSSIVALANKLREGALQSFSVIFSESKFSEAQFSRLIAKRYCKKHTEIELSQQDLRELLPQAIKAMDQPTIDGINVYVISKVVRDNGIKVVLSGQGGDEVFGGYSTFKRIPLINQMCSLIKPLPPSLREGMGAAIDILFMYYKIRSKFSQILESDGRVFSIYLILRQLLNPQTRAFLVKNDYNSELINGLPKQVPQDLASEFKELDTFNKISLLEMRLYLANMLLRDGDFMGMSHSLEIRVPFLNHKVVEFVFNTASEIKQQRNLPKPLLLKAMGNLLPEQIYHRPKMGFVFPWEIWLKNNLRPQVEGLLNDFPKNNQLGLNMDSCKSLWQMFISNTPGVTWSRVWGIYVLLRWYKENVCS